jgi:hypothetical protein
MLTAASRVWSVSEQRERETQLLFVGDEFRAAIAAYYAIGRHLRRLYHDPMTGEADWTLVLAPGGGIMGVASNSKLTSIKRTGFTQIDASYDNSDCYWQFVYEPRYFGRSAPVNPHL